MPVSSNQSLVAAIKRVEDAVAAQGPNSGSGGGSDDTALVAAVQAVTAAVTAQGPNGTVDNTSVVTAVNAVKTAVQAIPAAPSTVSVAGVSTAAKQDALKSAIDAVTAAVGAIPAAPTSVTVPGVATASKQDDALAVLELLATEESLINNSITLGQINTKIPTSPATLGMQTSQNTKLDAITAKLIAAPSTEAKQDVIKTAIDAITAKMIVAPATAAAQASILDQLGTTGYKLGDRVTDVRGSVDLGTVAVNAAASGIYQTRDRLPAALTADGKLTVSNVDADSSTIGTLAALNSVVDVAVRPGDQSCSIIMSGTWAGAAAFFWVDSAGAEQGLMMARPDAMQNLPANSSTANLTLWSAIPAGATKIRVKRTVFTSGTINVNVSVSRTSNSPAAVGAVSIVNGVTVTAGTVTTQPRFITWAETPAAVAAGAIGTPGVVRDATGVGLGSAAGALGASFRGYLTAPAAVEILAQASTDNVTFRNVRRVLSAEVITGSGEFYAEFDIPVITRYYRVAVRNPTAASVTPTTWTSALVNV